MGFWSMNNQLSCCSNGGTSTALGTPLFCSERQWGWRQGTVLLPATASNLENGKGKKKLGKFGLGLG